MLLRPLTVIALIFAAEPAAAEDSAIRLFAPAPNGPSSIESASAQHAPVQRASSREAGAIRLFTPVPSSPRAAPPLPMARQPVAPTIRGTVRETVAAQALDRAWIVAPR